jgi:hypothetical protein
LVSRSDNASRCVERSIARDEKVKSRTLEQR